MDIRLTMEEAEEVLFALALRSKQSRLSPLGQRTALAIGERLVPGPIGRLIQGRV